MYLRVFARVSARVRPLPSQKASTDGVEWQLGGLETQTLSIRTGSILLLLASSSSRSSVGTAAINIYLDERYSMAEQLPWSQPI